ncbi:MAG: PAS domain S-box protein [Candidatus Omnitrophota bacterium]
MRTVDGKLKFIEVHSTPISYNQQPAILGIVRDVTQRRQVEKKLEDSEQKYRVQFEKALDAIFIADANTGIVLDCNRAAERLLKRKKAEMIGQHQRILHPPEKIKEKFSQTFKRHLKEKEGQMLEAQVMTSDREIKDVAIMANLYELGGRVVLQGIFRDITERKLAEAALKDSEKQYRDLIDNSLVGIFKSDLTGKIFYVNKAAVSLMGYKSAKEMIEQGALSVYKDKMQRKAIIDILKKKGKVANFEVEIITKTGEVKNALLNMTLKGDIISGMSLDITARKQVEKRLAASERKYRNLVDNSLVGIYVTDIAGNVLYANKALCNLLEFNSVKEMLQFNVRSIYKDLNRRNVFLNILKKKGRVTNFEVEVVTGKGRTKNMLLSAVLDGDELIGMSMDITERKQAEHALEEAEYKQRELTRYYRSLVDQIDEYILVVDMDYQIVDVNECFLKKRGMRRKQVLGEKCYFIQHGAARPCHQTGAGCVLSNVIKTGKTCELTHKHVFGGKEIYLDIIGSPVFDIKRQLTGVILAMRNVTKIVEVRRALSESEERYRHLYDFAPCAYFSIGRNGLIRQCNRRAVELTGYSLSELMTKPIVELYADSVSGQKKAKEVFDRFLSGESINNEELQMQSKDGKIIWVSLSVRPIFDALGRVVESRSMVVDINTRKLETERLQELQKALFHAEKLSTLGRMAAELAHQINNPLMIIQGRAELLEMSIKNEEEKAKIKTLLEQCRRASKVTAALLNLSRKKELMFVSINLNSLINTIFNVNKEQFHAAGIDFQIALKKDLPNILADFQMLDDAIINLINNAKEAMPGGGCLKVSTADDGESVYINIADTGLGIGDEDKAKVFEHFFTTKNEGTGLGLPLVYNVIKAHRGDISFESEVGRGTTFRIRLPIPKEI